MSAVGVSNDRDVAVPNDAVATVIAVATEDSNTSKQT